MFTVFTYLFSIWSDPVNTLQISIPILHPIDVPTCHHCHWHLFSTSHQLPGIVASCATKVDYSTYFFLQLIFLHSSSTVEWCNFFSLPCSAGGDCIRIFSRTIFPFTVRKLRTSGIPPLLTVKKLLLLFSIRYGQLSAHLGLTWAKSRTGRTPTTAWRRQM